MFDIGMDDLCVTAPTSEPGFASGDTPRNAEWLRFDFEVRQALRAQKRAVMAAINASEAPARITVRSIQVASGRSRSQLYSSHSDLLPLIRSAQAAAERLMAQRAERARIVAAQPSRPALEQEVRRLRAEVKRLEAVKASEQAAEIFARMFTRDGERAQAEIAQLKAILDLKNAQLRNYAGLNAAMSALRPLAPGAGTIIDA